MPSQVVSPPSIHHIKQKYWSFTLGGWRVDLPPRILDEVQFIVTLSYCMFQALCASVLPPRLGASHMLTSVVSLSSIA